MASLPLYDINKKKIGNVDVDDSVFAGTVKPHLLHEVVRHQVAKRYENKTANSLTRSEVSGTRQKIYRQKGTGNARHGSDTAPIFVGGGKAHGPKPHRRRHQLNKKVMRSALISALSLAQKEDRFYVVDKLELSKHSTKSVASCQKAFGVEKTLFVNADDGDEQVFNLSTRNLPGVKVLKPEGVNVFDILKYQNILVSQKAVQKLTERLKGVVSDR